MAVELAGIVFDDVLYDEEGDVLYMSVGEPQAAAVTDASVEGHAIRYDADMRIIGITIVGARWILAREGGITVTPPRMVAGREAFAGVL